MTVPLCARSVAAVIGGLLVPAAWSSAVETLIVPRPGGGRLARRVAWIVNGAFRQAASVTAGYQRRDHVLARQAAAIMLTVLGAWLGTAFAGYWLLMWPLVRGGIGTAFGTLSDLAGPRYALGLSAAACLAAAIIGRWPARSALDVTP